MAEAAALEGCPAAMGEDRLLRYRAGFGQTLHQGQVGPVAFAQVAALFDGEALGHGVAGLFHQQRQWQQVVGHQLQQCRQGVLHQRQAGRRLPVGTSLLLQAVRRVVGADDVQASTEQGLAQGVAIGALLDRRVALDQVAEGGVVAVVEVQVVGADLGGDPFAGRRAGHEQLEFACRADVQHVQARAMAAGQAHRQAGRLVAGLGIADRRVLVGGDVVAVPGLPPRLAFTDARGVFAMRQQQGRTVTEQALQRRQVVDQHVAGAGAHEHLHPCHAVRVERGNGVEVVVTDAEVKAVVDPRAAGSALLLGRQRLQRQGRRQGVGHVHDAGDAAGHRRARFAGEAALVRRAGVAEVHLVVDHARQQVLAGGVEHGLAGEVGEAAGDGVDAPVADAQVGLEHTTFVDQPGVADQHAQNSFCRAL